MMYCLLILFAQQFTKAALFHSTARPGLNPYMREQKYFVGITWCNKNKNLSILYTSNWDWGETWLFSKISSIFICVVSEFFVFHTYFYDYFPNMKSFWWLQANELVLRALPHTVYFNQFIFVNGLRSLDAEGI